jgi:hypothetical protein
MTVYAFTWRMREAMVTLDPIAMDVCHRFIPWTEFVDVDFLVSGHF